jgi:histidyl-tRNA synthetase
MDAWSGLGLENIELRLSHSGVIRGIVGQLGLDKDEEAKLLVQLLEGNRSALADIKARDGNSERLLSLLNGGGRKSGFLANLKTVIPAANAELKAGIDDFARLCKLLDTVGIRYTIDLGVAPGFEYYTGVCFQFWLSGKKVGGGGRYDRLVPLMGGGEVPACGFAIYMDPLIGQLKPKTRKRADQGVLVRGSGTATESVRTCFELARSLRNAGYVAELDFSGREESGWQWSVTVPASGSPLMVTNRTLKKQKEAKSVAEAVNLMGVAG